MGWWWGIVDLSIARHLAFGRRTAQDGARGLNDIGAGGCGGDRRRGSRGQERCYVAKFDCHGDDSSIIGSIEAEELHLYHLQLPCPHILTTL
jgi:hypothetical protein